MPHSVLHQYRCGAVGRLDHLQDQEKLHLHPGHDVRPLNTFCTLNNEPFIYYFFVLFYFFLFVCLVFFFLGGGGEEEVGKMISVQIFFLVNLWQKFFFSAFPDILFITFRRVNYFFRLIRSCKFLFTIPPLPHTHTQKIKLSVPLERGLWRGVC